MAPQNIVKLRKAAIKEGMDAAEARTASRKALEQFIADASDNGNEPVRKRKSVKKAPRASTSARTATRKTKVEKETRKPGRPKKAKVEATKSARPKKSATRTSAPAAKSATAGKAKRQTAASNGDEPGRMTVGKIDYMEDEGWNPREGSVTWEIFRALKKAKDNVEKAIEALTPRLSELTPSKRRDGTKLNKAERIDILRYRVNRTRFDFAVKTGQHEPSTNRKEYTRASSNGQKTKPRAKKAEKPASASTAGRRMTAAAKPKRKVGRPKAGTTRKRS